MNLIMYGIIGIIVSLIAVLKSISELREESNKQGRLFIRLFSNKSYYENNVHLKQECKRIIVCFQNREIEWNSYVKVSRLTAASIITLTIHYVFLFCLNKYLKDTFGYLNLFFSLLSYILAFILIIKWAKLFDVSTEDISPKDTVFVISCTLSIPLIICAPAIGWFALIQTVMSQFILDFGEGLKNNGSILKIILSALKNLIIPFGKEWKVFYPSLLLFFDFIIFYIGWIVIEKTNADLYNYILLLLGECALVLSCSLNTGTSYKIVTAETKKVVDSEINEMKLLHESKIEQKKVSNMKPPKGKKRGKKRRK